MQPPDGDQIEVTLIGPGYGECSIVHLGNGHWIAIDSCIDSSTGAPAAVSYLQSLGIDPAKAVDLVLATHWHDDHIGGMAELVSRCSRAKFCCSAALGREEFVGLVRKFEIGSRIAGGSGVREINQVFNVLIERGQSAVAAAANRLVLRLNAGSKGHERDCSVWALSPSDKQYERFLFELTSLMPQVRETKSRCLALQPNHLSVVAWIEMEEVAVLMGGDLEETVEEGTGWSVIVASKERPNGKASVFKIPHHGSVNGHNDDVWNKMLEKQAFAILTPWNRGSKLPSVDDVARIVGLTPNAYSASRLRLPRRPLRPAPVEKKLKEMGVKLRAAEPLIGALRLRNGGAADPSSWEIELLREACHLSEVHLS